MNEEQLEQHAEECVASMKAQQEAFESQYDLAQYPMYWGDEDTIVLRSKSGSAPRREFDVVFVCRHAPDDRLAWAWADESLGKLARERSARIKELSAVTGFPQFETPVIDADGSILEKVVAIVLNHLDATACFVDKSKEPMLLVAIMGPGVEWKAKGAASAPRTPGTEEKAMKDAAALMAEVVEVLKGSAKDKLEPLFHGVNLPPNWFEMVAPEFTGLFGAEITASLIDIGDLNEDQLATLKTAPQDVQDSTEQAIKLDYVIPDSAEKVSGTLTLPVYSSPEGCKVLLVGG
jgi:hypothetical protein